MGFHVVGSVFPLWELHKAVVEIVAVALIYIFRMNQICHSQQEPVCTLKKGSIKQIGKQANIKDETISIYKSIYFSKTNIK